MLTDLQKAKMTRLFHFWDLNHNGYLDKADYETIVTRIANERGWQKGSTDFASTYNTVMTNWAQVEKFAQDNDNQNVYLPDWLAYCDYVVNNQSAYRIHAMELMMTLLNAVDTNGDGQITREDYKMWFRIFGNSDEEAERAFDHIDTDNSNVLSLDEMIHAVDEFFQSNARHVPGNHMFGELSED